MEDHPHDRECVEVRTRGWSVCTCSAPTPWGVARLTVESTGDVTISDGGTTSALEARINRTRIGFHLIFVREGAAWKCTWPHVYRWGTAAYAPDGVSRKCVEVLVPEICRYLDEHPDIVEAGLHRSRLASARETLRLKGLRVDHCRSQFRAMLAARADAAAAVAEIERERPGR